MKRTSGPSLLAAALLCCTVLGPRTAAARTRFCPALIALYGTRAFEAGPLPAPWDKKKGLEGYRAGYKCKVFALFWAYIHRWDCEAVAMQGPGAILGMGTDPRHVNMVKKLNAAIAKKYPPSAVKLGFWAKHGRIILGLILVALILAGILRARKKP